MRHLRGRNRLDGDAIERPSEEGSELTEPRWADTTVIAGEVAAVSELKDEPDGELHVHGSGALVRWLWPSGRPEYATSTANASWRQS